MCAASSDGPLIRERDSGEEKAAAAQGGNGTEEGEWTGEGGGAVVAVERNSHK